jgi:hypothetical protein
MSIDWVFRSDGGPTQQLCNLSLEVEIILRHGSVPSSEL